MRSIDEVTGLPEVGPQGREGANPFSISNETLEDSILSGDELHDSVVRLAMRGYSREQLVSLLNDSAAKAERPDRWRDVMDSDLPRALKSAKLKKDKETERMLAGMPIPPRYSSDTALHTFCAASLAGKPIPAQRWLIRDFIIAGQPILLSGDGGLGKSLLALQLAVAVATGGRWLGKFAAQGPVLYLSAEDEAAEIHRRLECVATNGLDKLTDLHIAPMAEIDALLVAPGIGGKLDTTALFAAVAARVSDLLPALVVLDSNADFYGGNEVVRSEVRWFVGQLRKLCHSTGCTVLILSHPSVSGMQSGSGLSGSTHWNNSVRSRLYLTRPDGESPDPDERVLAIVKNNRGAVGQRISMRWKGGAFVANEVADTQVTSADVDEWFAAMLATYNRRKMNVSTSAGTTYAPAVFAKEGTAKARRITRRMLVDAMGRLLDAGRIINVAHRSGADARYHLELAETVAN
jgi:AAA domain